MSAGSVSALFAESRDAGFVARFDPRLRLILALAFALTLAFVTTPLALTMAVTLALAMICGAGVSLEKLWRRMLAVEGFLIVLVITLPFTVSGTALVSFVGLTASAEGLARALILALRINAAVLMSVALLGGLGGQRLAGAMGGIGLPPVLVGLMLMTLRYAPTIGEEYRRLRTAMRVRGFRAGSNRHTWRCLGYLVGVLLVRSLERGERVYAAMKCRGYTGRYPVPTLAPPQRRDWLLLGIGVIAIAAMLLVEVAT